MPDETIDPTAENPASDPADAFRRLEEASAPARAELVLELIAAHPEGRLVLPGRDGSGALLRGVDLGRTALEARVDVSPAGVAWWETDWRGVRLRAAELAGADLREAVLVNAVLEEADLAGAVLRHADLREVRGRRARFREADLAGARLAGAVLEEADLHKAEMAGADLQGADLAGADLAGAMLEEADLRGANLRFADLRGTVLEMADLRGADLRGAKMAGADLTGANLEEAVLEEAVLDGCDLREVRFGRAVLSKASVRGADLTGADLREAHLNGADFREADLGDTRLQDLDLTTCRLEGIHLSGARLEETRFLRDQLGECLGEERAGELDAAARGYLALEQNFQRLGDPDAASWAYRRRRRMQKREALRRARSSWSARRPLEAARLALQYASDQVAEWVCDYGESIPRVLASLFVLYVVFTILYGVTDSVVLEEEGPDGEPIVTRNPVDLAIFSLLAMTTGTVGVDFLPRGRTALTLIGVHVFIGIALIGLLGFVLGNRIRR